MPSKPPPPPPDKKKTLQAFLQRGVAMLHVDARRPGVSVPAQFAGEAHLRLNLSYRYSIPDLDLDDQRVQATLSFGGQPFQCIVPWPAIFGITSNGSGDGQVWPADLPVEVTQTMGDKEPGEAAPAPVPARPARAVRPALAAVSVEDVPEPAPPAAVRSGPSAPAPAPAAPASDGAAGRDGAGPERPDDPPKRHLRLVR